MLLARKHGDVRLTEIPRVDWRSMFVESKPLLEWAAAHPEIVGEEHAQHARRSLVRFYLATSNGPGLAKAPRPPTRIP